mmetsp:Transcript_68131/g.197488  ORF Transcript_68131/g.197488 Transcript_68131/m.197488 type:complete len:212 (-) Transcript_68131:780-1415(-)
MIAQVLRAIAASGRCSTRSSSPQERRPPRLGRMSATAKAAIPRCSNRLPASDLAPTLASDSSPGRRGVASGSAAASSVFWQWSSGAPTSCGGSACSWRARMGVPTPPIRSSPAAARTPPPAARTPAKPGSSPRRRRRAGKSPARRAIVPQQWHRPRRTQQRRAMPHRRPQLPRQWSTTARLMPVAAKDEVGQGNPRCSELLGKLATATRMM